MLTAAQIISILMLLNAFGVAPSVVTTVQYELTHPGQVPPSETATTTQAVGVSSLPGVADTGNSIAPAQIPQGPVAGNIPLGSYPATCSLSFHWTQTQGWDPARGAMSTWYLPAIDYTEDAPNPFAGNITNNASAEPWEAYTYGVSSASDPIGTFVPKTASDPRDDATVDLYTLVLTGENMPTTTCSLQIPDATTTPQI